jgi:mannitol 2-dehydrogenase
VHDVAQEPLFADFLLAYMEREASPTLEPVPGIDLDAYRHQLIERFSNAQVRDTVARLCAESSDRIPKWLVPVIRHNLENDGEILRATAVVASWARYAEGRDEEGQPIEVVDRLAPELKERARTRTFIQNRDLFGDLADNERFVATYTRVLSLLHDVGSRKTLKELE